MGRLVVTKPKRLEAESPAADVSAWLKRNGFAKVDSFTVKLGNIVVLLPRQDQPWWTVQKRNGANVRWFVDFPEACPAAAVCRFIESI